VIGQAVAAAAQPALARLWAAGRGGELDRVLGTTLRGLLALGLLAGAALLALAEPLVALVYQRGAFTPADAGDTARLLVVFSAAVPAWVVQQMAVRAFYARGDTWRPMLLGSAFALGAAPLYLALGRSFGVPGIAAAGAIAMTANALATLGYARWRFGGPALQPIAGSGLRALAIAAPAAAAATACIAGRAGTLGALTDLALGSAAFAAVAVLGVATIGDAVLRDVLRRLGARLVGRRAPVA
jgi:putative peptidoglycan lipid II flippase